MANRFDLEQQIMQCWGIVDELEYVMEAVEEGDDDKILNLLIGLKELYSRKFDKMFNTFEECIKKGELERNISLNSSVEQESVGQEKKKSVEPFGW